MVVVDDKMILEGPFGGFGFRILGSDHPPPALP
jgi:hypothetical protein